MIFLIESAEHDVCSDFNGRDTPPEGSAIRRFRALLDVCNHARDCTSGRRLALSSFEI